MRFPCFCPMKECAMLRGWDGVLFTADLYDGREGWIARYFSVFVG